MLFAKLKHAKKVQTHVQRSYSFGAINHALSCKIEKIFMYLLENLPESLISWHIVIGVWCRQSTIQKVDLLVVYPP